MIEVFEWEEAERLHVEASLEGIMHRAVDTQPILDRMIGVFEDEHSAHFRKLGGQERTYVRTGALRASLTQSDARGAIREAHGDKLLFGTSISYAQYQREGGAATTKGKSAVLVLTPDAQLRLGSIAGDHLMGRLRDSRGRFTKASL